MSLSQERLLATLHLIWDKQGASPEYIQVMRLALLNRSSPETHTQSRLSQWMELPGLCTLAAGGDVLHADVLTLAWLLFYRAAALMDAVQDQDEPDDWWAAEGPGYALNVASGLYFSAALALQLLPEYRLSAAASREISQAFYRAFLQMGNGQHIDLSTRRLSLEDFWKVADAKSGSFFALGCWSGARLATRNKVKLSAYQLFGHHLGILIQIKDELDEVLASKEAGEREMRNAFDRSLPVLYALDVLPPAEKSRLEALLELWIEQKQASSEIFEILDSSGVSSYLLYQFELNRYKALEELKRAEPTFQAADDLERLVFSL